MASITSLGELLLECHQRQTKGHPRFFHRFPPDEAARLHTYFKEHLPGWAKQVLEGQPVHGLMEIITNCQICTGVNRIVIGDYGAYAEMLPEQMIMDNIRNRFNHKPTRPVKYIWMTTTVPTGIKIYFQQGRVGYADYVPGRYYVTPSSVAPVQARMSPHAEAICSIL